MDLYGTQLEVELLTRIRNEQTFNSITSLKKQIEQDVLFAKNLLSKNGFAAG